MKRFYKTATVNSAGSEFQISLDDRALKTALGKPQIVPARALAEALAEEWNAQGADIDASLFRHRDLADFAIDIVAADRAETISKLLRFIETDTLCYRADPDEPLYRKQQEVWEPLLAAFEQREGVTLQRISGIMHRPQAQETLDRLTAKLAALDDFTIAALLTMTSLAASLSIGMSALEPDADAGALWLAASLEEDWQIEQWGYDYEAEAVRTQRKAGFLSAWDFLQLVRG